MYLFEITYKNTRSIAPGKIGHIRLYQQMITGKVFVRWAGLKN